jgi:hypothetical protein
MILPDSWTDEIGGCCPSALNAFLGGCQIVLPGKVPGREES